jgi:hypothetical protein
MSKHNRQRREQRAKDKARAGRMSWEVLQHQMRAAEDAALRARLSQICGTSRPTILLFPRSSGGA